MARRRRSSVGRQQTHRIGDDQLNDAMSENWRDIAAKMHRKMLEKKRKADWNQMDEVNGIRE